MWTQHLLRTHSKLNVIIHSDTQKKDRSTKEMMERPTSTTTEQVWRVLHSVADDNTVRHDSPPIRDRKLCFSEPSVVNYLYSIAMSSTAVSY